MGTFSFEDVSSFVNIVSSILEEIDFMIKTVGIDANEANVEKRVGISEYAFQILSNIYELRKKNETNYNFVIYLKQKPMQVLPPQSSWWKYKVVAPKKMWTQIAMPIHLFLSANKPDVFLTLTHYAPRFAQMPTIVSVMDLSYLHFPQTFRKNDLYQLTKWTKYSVEKSKKVITISNSSKDDIIKHYKVPAEKVEVVHLGLKPISMEQHSKQLSDFGITKKFVLFVGTLQPRKNISKLVESFSLLPQSIKDNYQLVIVGKKGWLYEDILSSPEKYHIQDKVVFLDYVSDRQLPMFYKNAEVFVLPSLYEGFGLPILEAMRYGCPVVTSNVSSLPEAGGDAALYFDPESAQDIMEHIQKVLTNSELRNKMIEKGTSHYKKFTWEKAAQTVLKTIDEVIEK